MFYSIVIPVYNRPEELTELLESICALTYPHFEVIVVEDGSKRTSFGVVEHFKESIELSYITQKNTGPGLARNNGAQFAKGDYIIFLDSDTIVPQDYLDIVDAYLSETRVDAWGGKDEAMDSFTDLQKAINYSMTSFFTTGGIRGRSGKKLDNFYPRSFNMGISQEVFSVTGGFSSLRFGEDIDFSYRIIEAGFKTALIDDAFVYHKRRNSRKSFLKQVFYSGMARVNVSLRHKGTLKIVHLFPSIFIIGSLVLMFFMTILPLLAASIVWFVDSLLWYRNISISIMAVETSFVQVVGYGSGFLYGVWNRIILRKPEQSSYNTNFH